MGRDRLGAKAAELVEMRLRDELGMFFNGAKRSDIPRRTDMGDVPFYRNRENKTRLYGEQSGHCHGCGGHFQIQNMEIDHIVAQSKGGTDHIDNL
ncbi:MAG: HNH endonuclease signature motif containing protein, partial [Rhodospirillaceae bacterium]|nr:HNH endonuclease signature motif containing protein [Rhodospirillaceae bacterium]